MATAFAVFLLSFFIGICRKAVSAVGCRSPPFQSGLLHFKNFRLEGKNGIQQRTGEQEMAYLERSRGKNIAGMADKEKQAEAMTVAEMLKPGIPL